MLRKVCLAGCSNTALPCSLAGSKCRLVREHNLPKVAVPSLLHLAKACGNV